MDEQFTMKQYVVVQMRGTVEVVRRCPDGHVVEFRQTEDTGDVPVYLLKINDKTACMTCGWVDD